MSASRCPVSVCLMCVCGRTMNVAFGMPRFPLSTSRVAGAAGGADALVEDAEDILATNRNWCLGRYKRNRCKERIREPSDTHKQTNLTNAHIHAHTCVLHIFFSVGRCPPPYLLVSVLSE